MQPKNPKDIVKQILEQQRLDKADFKGPGMLDQDSFDMPFSLSQEAKNTLNNYYTAAAKQVKNNPEVFTINNIKEGATLLNSGFASEAQLSKSQLQEELIKALNAEKIEHNLKPIRKKQTTGGLQNPEKADLDKDGKLSSYEQARGEAIEESMREQKQEGGMMMDNQMSSMMQEQETPMIDNQMEKMIGDSQVPDEIMEDNYVDFLIDEALSEEEETMLMQELQANPQLSMLFDKVMEVAMEFSGSGPVEGPGSEVSDSIPARLSDGEFVFTAKSVDVIGADNLMSLMKQAEAQADQRQMAQEGGLMEEEETVMPVQQEPVRQDIRVTKETVGSQASVQEEDDLVGDELKKQMLSGRPHVRS
tara:strand:- start:1212 stop:2297 length:1086 start_codon:yes stop_codon:yes gene_type:complete